MKKVIFFILLFNFLPTIGANKNDCVIKVSSENEEGINNWLKNYDSLLINDAGVETYFDNAYKAYKSIDSLYQAIYEDSYFCLETIDDKSEKCKRELVWLMFKALNKDSSIKEIDGLKKYILDRKNLS